MCAHEGILIPASRGTLDLVTTTTTGFWHLQISIFLLICTGKINVGIRLFHDPLFLDISVVDYLDIIRYEVGDKITMEYKVDVKANVVLSIK